MTHMDLRYMLFSLGLWYLSSNVFCFEADSLNSQGDYTHTNITRGALDKAAAYYIANILEPGHYNLSTQTTDQIIIQYFSKDRNAERKYNWAVDEIVKGIAIAFYNAKSSTKITMNNEMIAEGIRYLYSKRISIATLSQTDSSWTLVREQFGELLFTLQDFYSNTNWIEIGKGVLHDLGWKSTIDFPIARPDQPTCASCKLINGTSIETCRDNLLVNSVLTSGYMDKTVSNGSDVKPYDQKWPQGQGKCSHGGVDDGSRFLPATGGINKESTSPLKSPHYYLHSKAGEIAADATIDFLIRKELSLLTELGYTRFGKLIGLESRQSPQCVHCNDPSRSIAFVIDTTSTMGTYIFDLRKYVLEITRTQIPSFSPANYILVTFSDRANETTFQETNNGEELESWLSSLYPHGGDDCPKYSMTGLITAMQRARHGSCIFLLTDAGPKDTELQPIVFNLIQSKHLHLVSILNGHCNDTLQNSTSYANDPGCILDIRRRRSDGNFYHVPSGNDVTAPITDILKLLTAFLVKKMPSDKIIIDLKEIVKGRAWNFYLKTRKLCQPKTLKNVELVIDWSDVTFDVKTPVFTETIGSEHFVTNVIFRSVFDNNSTMPQTHSLKAERQTTASCKTSLSKSFTTSTNMGLTLHAPGSIVKASVGFSAGFNVNLAKETTDQKTLTWVSEGSLTVPSQSKLTAELEIIERHSEYTFKSAVAISGTVIVNIFSKKDSNKFLKTYTGDMKAILKDKYKDIKTEGSRTVFLDIEGECDFKYGIEQQIKIT